MAKTITLSFDLFGNSKLDAEGFQGTSCEEASKNYVLALDSESKQATPKPEYYAPASTKQTAKQGW